MFYVQSKQLAACRASVSLLTTLSTGDGSLDDQDPTLTQLLPLVDEVKKEFARLDMLAQAKQKRMKENR